MFDGRQDVGAVPTASTINTLEYIMKYKMVVKVGNKTFVKARSKSKKHLEERALAYSKKKPYATVYVVKETTII